MRLQDDRPGVTSEELRTLAVPGVDVDVELLARASVKVDTCVASRGSLGLP